MATILSTKTSGVGGLTVTGDASGVLQLASANGTTAVTIDASQNVGIGTTTPTNKLTVNGGIDFLGSAFSGSGTGIWQQATNKLGFVTAGSTRFTIDASGNVGIGTTTPTYKLQVTGLISDSHGNVRSVPQNAQGAAYTLVALDNGKHISITTGGVIVPASIMSIGDIVSIYNNSAASQTITTSAVTCYLAGTATTGTRTLAQRGLATILCVASNVFVISGAGLT